MPEQSEKITHEKLTTVTEPEAIEMINYHLSGFDPDQKSDIIARLYQEELVRRRQDKTNQVMLDYTQEVHRFTRQMRNMTIAILVATFLTLLLSLYNF